MDEPYPGSNIFSLASGGAIYLRDPGKTLIGQQLNGGVVESIDSRDWELILPYLEENERLFGIRIDDLLKVDGKAVNPLNVYRKVVPATAASALGCAVPDDADDEFVAEEVLYETSAVSGKSA
jgi:hypothetical protein